MSPGLPASQRFRAALGIPAPPPFAWTPPPHRVVLLDMPALTQCFHGQVYLMRLLDEADADRIEVLLPAAVLAEAQGQLRLEPADWRALLDCRGVRTVPLTEEAAIGVGHRPGPLWFRHVVREARALGAPIVTALPDAYRGVDVTLLPLPPG